MASVIDGNLIGIDSLLAGFYLTLFSVFFAFLGCAYEESVWLAYQNLYDLWWCWLIIFIVFTLCSIIPVVVLLILIYKANKKAKNYFNLSILGIIIFTTYGSLLLFFRGVTGLESFLIGLAWAITGFLTAIRVKHQVEQLTIWQDQQHKE